jgi:hypothetical protein
MNWSQAVIDLWQGTLPQCHKDACIWQLQYFLAGAWITETGSDCRSLSIITANGWTLSLARPNKVQQFKSPHGVSGYKMLSNYIYSLHVALASEHPPLEHTVTFVKLPLFCQKRYSRGKSTVGEWRRNPMWPKIRYVRGVTEVVTMIKHKETAGGWKNYPL